MFCKSRLGLFAFETILKIKISHTVEFKPNKHWQQDMNIWAQWLGIVEKTKKWLLWPSANV